jgi:hypothetical protein
MAGADRREAFLMETGDGEDERGIDLGKVQFNFVDEEEVEVKMLLMVTTAWCEVYYNGGATLATAAVSSALFLAHELAEKNEKKVRSGGGRRE